jgi:hypothetical protein
MRRLLKKFGPSATGRAREPRAMQNAGAKPAPLKLAS